ncbi:MAG: hypothetical protein PPFGHCPK_01404 (plasmid) [Spiroplasma endosymbiont of Drosophila atripex]|nr:MAG: hypothetical protein PPFGHCPK_01404 [Spiroplasma endosymbiont of Drosophila atripex]
MWICNSVNFTTINKSLTYISEADLQEIINNFEENFKEWKEQKNFFNNSKEIDFKNPNASAQMMALKEINKNKIDDLINELRNDLKYNFFSYFWEKKEDLNLIIKLKDISKEIDNKIIKQNHQLLELEKNKSLIEQEKNYENDNFFDSKNSLNYLSSFIKEINSDILFLKEINIKNKKFFLKELRELNNKIKNDIKNMYYEIQELESKNNNIFEKIYSEAIMTNLISSFWSFRKKNNDDKYELIENIKTKNKTNQNFLYNFELIDIIFNKYIEYIIKNEEKINKKEKEIKNNKCNIADLEDSLKNEKNQLNIKNERIKKIEKNIIEINLFIKNNDNIMIHELQNIKEKWIIKIRIDQKKFSTSLKEINKLKNIEFITLIDDFWKIKDNKNIILSLNKKYNVEHNIKNIKEKIEKNIIEMKMDLEKVETEFINKNKEITEIIKTKISPKFRKCLEKITSLELKNITTQTVINEQNENLNLIKSQKLQELEQKLDKNQHEFKILEQKLIEINKIFEEEKTEWKNES